MLLLRGGWAGCSPCASRPLALRLAGVAHGGCSIDIVSQALAPFLPLSRAGSLASWCGVMQVSPLREKYCPVKIIC
jgi:hypothetical protein